MRAVGVHPDVIVITSRFWATTATAIRSDGESMLIDSPYFPDELEALPAILGQAGFEPSGLLATHGDWDHLLGRFAYPGLALGVGEPTGLRLREEPGAAQRELRDADAEYYVVRSSPLSLGSFQTLPVPGYVEIGSQEMELHPADGHTTDGTAFFARWAGVLIVGDYLSEFEIPWITGGSLADYKSTLARLAPLVEAANIVVPGHGSPHPRDTALRLMDEDLDYLDALERGDEKPALPSKRDTKPQRKIHADNLREVHGSS